MNLPPAKPKSEQQNTWQVSFFQEVEAVTWLTFAGDEYLISRWRETS
jgi:hypothetical protein